MDVVVLQHIACEPPGEYETVLRERGMRLHRVELDEGDPLPNLTDFDAIVAMGGPMSVNDDAELTLSAATALNPHIGYDRATAIVKQAAASGRSLRDVAREQGVDDAILDAALDYRAMTKPHLS